MNRDDFISKYPRLFHMAASGSWPSIAERGLLSTRALVDLYDPPAELRSEILEQVRKRSVVLSSPGLPDAIVRDQLPLKFLSERLMPGVSEQKFLDELNGRVFFHVSEERLRRLLGARAYRRHPHEVLTIDTETFLVDHPEVELAAYNTGSVHLRTMPERGPSMFIPLPEYDWADWRRRRGSAENAVVELTVRRAAFVERAVVGVERWYAGELVEIVLAR
jgi:hypothetical protein